jgi:hypothetical protein
MILSLCSRVVLSEEEESVFLFLRSLRRKLAKRPIPVLVWNSIKGSWEPIDFWNGQRLVEWPHGFRQELLPIPENQEGDRVQFVRDESCAREGTVHLFLFQGDISRMQAEQGEAIKRSNLGADDIIYLVTTRGHDHRVKASHILGRFVSLERVSRVLPLRE